MNAYDALWHILHFTAPALAVAALVSLGGPFLVGQAILLDLRRRFAFNALAALVVLLAGLWFWGNDGKMSTYAAMVVVCASSQWVLTRAWRR